MTDRSTLYDHFLSDTDAVPAAALVIREHLMPVEGSDGVFFPSTFASGEDFSGGYNLDGPDGGENVCLIDTVGSQANRIEPEFRKPRYAALIPQIVVRAGDRDISILEAGHRAGDALFRCSSIHKEIHDAFVAVQTGNARLLALIAPTSLVFGVWDSRDTQAKLPRVVASTIRAFNVRRLTRSAQFVPAASYVDEELLPQPADKGAKEAYAERGFIHVPASGAHGGIIATGGVRRDATLSLAAIRLLKAGNDPDATIALRRYILGLSLVAFTHPSAYVGFLRQGCLLVLNPDKPREFVEVAADGKRTPCSITHEVALEYAAVAATAFGVGPTQTATFDKARAVEDVQQDEIVKQKKGKGKGK